MFPIVHAMPKPDQAKIPRMAKAKSAPTVDLEYFNRTAYLPHQALVGQRIECDQHSFESISGKDNWISKQGEIVVQSLLFGVEIGAIQSKVIAQLCKQDDIHNRNNTDIVKNCIEDTLIHISDHLAEQADAYFGEEQLKIIDNDNFEIDLHWQDNDFDGTEFGTNEEKGFRLSVLNNMCVSNLSSKHESFGILVKLLLAKIYPFALCATLEEYSVHEYMGEIGELLEDEDLVVIRQFNQDILALMDIDDEDDDQTAIYFIELANKHFPNEADCWKQMLEYDELYRIQHQIQDYIDQQEATETLNIVKSRIGQSSFDLTTEIGLLREVLHEHEELLPYFDKLAKIVTSAFTMEGATYSEIVSNGSDEPVESQRIIISEGDMEYSEMLERIHNRCMETGEIASLVIDINDHEPTTILKGLTNAHLANLSLVLADYITTEANEIKANQH